MAISKEFILGGKAVFTVQPADTYLDSRAAAGVECAAHYTYRVIRKEPSTGKDGKQYGEAWFVSLRDGKQWLYLGMLSVRSGTVTLTAGSRFGPGCEPVTIIQRLLPAIWRDGKVDNKGGWAFHQGEAVAVGAT